jgi:hypothetical protein
VLTSLPSSAVAAKAVEGRIDLTDVEGGVAPCALDDLGVQLITVGRPNGQHSEKGMSQRHAPMLCGVCMRVEFPLTH